MAMWKVAETLPSGTCTNVFKLCLEGGQDMKRLIAILATVFLTGAGFSPAAASLTREQLIETCRPQLQTFIQEILSEPARVEVATEEENLDGVTPDPEYVAMMKEEEAIQEQNARDNERDKANLRANGLNDPFILEMVDGVITSAAAEKKPLSREFRSEIADMKREMAGITDARGLGSEMGAAVAGTCLVEAVVADIDGKPLPTNASGVSTTSQSASVAAVEARNKDADDAADAAEAAGVPLTQLRPTAMLVAHNPANEASNCLEPIAKTDFETRGVSSIMGAVFRNSCAYPIETQWCIGDEACARGFDNLATMPANGDRGFSFDAKADTLTTVHWAACRLGFGYRPDLEGTIQYVCK